MELDWTWGEADSLAREIERYSRVVLHRVLPSLSGLTESGEEAAAPDWTNLSEATLPDELYPPSPDHDPEAVRPDGVYSMVAMELGLIRHGLFGLMFAGLFHLFERQLMGALRRADARSGRVLLLPEERELELKHKLDLRQMQAILARGGYPIECSRFAPALRKLQLVANTAKHADGQSAYSLLKEFPDLVNRFPGDALTVYSMLLSPELFQELSDAVATFWRGFPENVPSQGAA